MTHDGEADDRMIRPGARWLAVAVPLLLVVLVACTKFRIRTDFDPAVDFTRLRSYAWLPLDQADPADQRLLDRYLDKRLRTAVESELGKKGFRPAGSGTPDLLLNYRLSTSPDEAQRGAAILLRAPMWASWRANGAYYVESYDAGTLYVGVIDGNTRRLVWLGAAEARLMPHASLEKTAKRVDAVAHKILEDFPPTGKGAAAGQER